MRPAAQCADDYDDLPTGICANSCRIFVRALGNSSVPTCKNLVTTYSTVITKLCPDAFAPAPAPGSTISGFFGYLTAECLTPLAKNKPLILTCARELDVRI